MEEWITEGDRFLIKWIKVGFGDSTEFVDILD